jgi:hypothetical protein
MLTDNIKVKGEHTSVAEELLAEVPELEQKCRAIDKAVREGYFTLPEALAAYEVKETEYIAYFLLQFNKKLKKTKKQDQVFQMLYAVVSIFDTSIFDKITQNFIINLKKDITQNQPSAKKMFEKNH